MAGAPNRMPRFAFVSQGSALKAVDVSVCDHEAVYTGLLDADGDEIWREPNPIGFGRDGEW